MASETTDLADAEALFQRGVERGYGDGDVEAGLKDLRAALAIVRQHDASHLEAQLWTWIAAFQTTLDDHRGAESSFREAQERLEPQDQLGHWWLDLSIATTLLADGRGDAMEAERLVRDALVLEASDTPLRDFWIANLLDFGRGSGTSPPGTAEAVPDSIPRLRSMAEAVARFLRGHQLAASRHVEPAIEQLRLAASASTRADGFYSTTIVETLTATLVEDQQLDAAIDVLAKHLSENPTASTTDRIRQLRLRALIEKRAGQLDAAGRHFREALRMARSVGKPLGLAESHHDLGGYFLRLGQYETAAGHLERALDLFTELEHPRAGACHARLELVYQQLGVGDLVRSTRPSAGTSADRLKWFLIGWISNIGSIHAEPFRDLLRDVPTDELPLESRNLMDHLAAVLAAVEDVQQHGGDLDRLADTLKQSDLSMNRWMGLLIAAKADLDHKRWREALTKIEQVLAEHRQTPDPEPGADVWAHYLRSHALWQGNRSGEALRAVVEALDAHDAIGSDTTVEAVDTARRSHGIGPPLYAQAITLHARVGKANAAFHLAERYRAQTLARLGDPDVKPADWVERSPMLDAMRAEIADLDKRSRDASGDVYDQLRKELSDARRRFERRMVRGKVRRARSMTRLPVAVLDLDEARSLLGPDELLVSYYTTDRQLLRWTLDAERADLQVLDLGATTLEQWVDCWLRSLATGAGRSTRVSIRRHHRATMQVVESCGPHEAVGGALYSALLQGLDLDAADRRLFVIPHGPLHSVPFAALRDPLADRYLAEEIAVVYLPSVGSLAEFRLGDANRDAAFVERSENLIVGDPISYLPALPGARREATDVARLLNVEPLIGSDATEAMIRDKLSTSRLVHIAAHGVFDTEDPRFSRLVLSGDPRFDGYLEVHEILDLPLSSVERVVLSGCQTGLGEITAGDDVIGLARSWLFAGARSVVSTLWMIDDEVSSRLMVDFYHRSETGNDPAEALRQAQVHLLQDPETRSPTFWAAYTYWGDPSPHPRRSSK
ncbi:MAG: CHAT domain-containing tetratricopeptide repeat protein [Acidobacteriota bacterium]